MSTSKVAIIGLLTVLMVAAGAAAQNSDTPTATTNSKESQQYLQQICRNTSFPQRCFYTLSKASNFSDPRSLLNVLFQEATKECERVKKLHMIHTATNYKNAPAADVYHCCSEYLDMAVIDLNLATKSLNSLGTSRRKLRRLIYDIRQGISNADLSAQTCYRPQDCGGGASEDLREKIKTAVKGIEEFSSIGSQLAYELPDLLNHFGINLDIPNYGTTLELDDQDKFEARLMYLILNLPKK